MSPRTRSEASGRGSDVPLTVSAPPHGEGAARRWTLADVLTLPAVVDLVTAGQVLGIGRTSCYLLARAGTFPCPVMRIGGTWRVPTAGLLAVLGVPLPHPPVQDRADDGRDEAGQAGPRTRPDPAA